MMTFAEALTEIRTFWPELQDRFTGGGGDEVRRLEDEFGRAFPQFLREYIADVMSATMIHFKGVGNGIDLYGFEDLSTVLDGYNFNPLTSEPLEGWSADWLLIGDEGADPIIIDLSSDSGEVLQSMHGEGEWEFRAIAESLPQLILLLAALHHALTLGPADPDEKITDDEHGFNLNSEAAEWLFPRVRRWAPRFYKNWAGVFDNA